MNDDENKCLKLLHNKQYDNLRYFVKNKLIDSNYSIDSYFFAAKIFCWLSSKTESIEDIYQGLEYSEKSKNLFNKYYNKHIDNNLNFILPITLPKSGGTFIFNFLNNSVGYSKNFIYAYGTESAPYLCEHRTEHVYKNGGTILHNHLKYNKHNVSIIKKLNLPIWIHIRDPRDAYFSFLNMYIKGDDIFRKKVNKAFAVNENYEYNFIDDIAIDFIGMLNYYCEFIKTWTDLEHETRYITYYSDFQDDNVMFCKALCQKILKIDQIENINMPEKNWKNRFFKGKDGQWIERLNPSTINKINKIYDEYNLDYLFTGR